MNSVIRCKKCRYKKGLIMFGMILTLILINYSLIVNALDDYNNKENLENFYLNIDNLNYNGQDLEFDLNNIETNLSGKESINIDLNLQYKTLDSSGVETIKGVIDFTVENTKFTSKIDEGKLCTRWEVYSTENEEVTTVCYGNESCCNFVSLIPTRSNWKETFYLTYGLYGASYNNVVSAQVIHVDYDTISDNPYSKIYYSKWGSLYAIFKEEGIIPTKIIAMNNALNSLGATLNLSIISPDNSAPLTSGENVYLNFTTNTTASAVYYLDNFILTDLGNGTSFSTLLNGTLPYGTLANDQHNISIYIKDTLSEDNTTVDYSFIVNDTKSPVIYINITNNSVLSATSLGLHLGVTSDEYANISYKINNGGFSNFIDLGNEKKTILNLNPVNGINNLVINATDLHYNSILHYYSFNFIELGSCLDGIQNGYETGIDCGGQCSACINFNITLDRPTYNLTDNVYVTVVARANSVVDLSVYKKGEISYRHTFTPVFLGAPIAEIRKIENTSSVGVYYVNAIMYYLNATESKNLEFEVVAPYSNPISLTINANATTINEGDTVTFTESISGQSGSVSYKWDFENDGTIDSTSKDAIKAYDRNGTYIVNLTVSDNLWNQTDIETITVKKLHNVTFLVRDNSTQNIIEGAEVELNSILKNTSSDGRVLFTIAKGQYNVQVEKSGYNTYSMGIDVNENQEMLVNLTEKDNIAPKIELISPENNGVVSNKNVTFKYIAVDKSDMTCRLYYDLSGSSFFGIKAVNNSVKSDMESKFEVKNLENGTYQWKVDCIDHHGNINSSAIMEFVLNEEAIFNELSINLDDQDRSIGDILNQINEVIKGLGKLNTKEKEAAEAMQLKRTLEKAITSLERANRDLNSLKWRRLNGTELEEETKKILDKIEDIKGTTPKSLEVVESTEFVKYPTKEDIRIATLIQLNQTNLKINNKELDRLVDKNNKLQSLITVTTNARIISLEYLSGNKETITLIQKTLSSSGNLSDVEFYEIIPKDIAQDIDEIKFLFDYKTVERDPVIEIDVNLIKDYAYYIKKKLSLDEAEKTKSILLSKDLEIEKKSLITGFSIFNNTTSNWVKTSDKRLITEIIIIILLAAVYLVYSFGGIEYFKIMLNGREIKDINAAISLALADLKNNDYEKGSSSYKEISSKFIKLEKKKKDMVKNSVIELANKVNLLYVNKLADEAMNNLKSNKKIALSNYQKIRSLYKIFPKQYKAEVSKKCLMLHKELDS